MSEESFKKAAHDLNNLLTGISNGIELLNQNKGNEEELERVLEILSRTSSRALDIIRTVLNQKVNDDSLESVNLPEIVEEIVRGCSISEQKRISFAVNETLPNIIAKGTNVYRIIQNLCKNALEATEDKGEVKINLKTIGVEDKNKLILEITDTGSGIKDTDIDRIFDPKFSTKEKSVDSGFGLSIVKEMIDELNGNISVSNENNQTKFTVTLPTESSAENSELKILLVEDDESVSEVLADLLGSHGYKVKLSTSGIPALEHAKKSNFDLMIIDKKLPDLDGIELIDEIRKDNNEVPIILASGSDVDQQTSEIGKLKIDRILRKPYKFPELLSAIKSLSL